MVVSVPVDVVLVVPVVVSEIVVYPKMSSMIPPSSWPLVLAEELLDVVDVSVVVDVLEVVVDVLVVVMLS